MNEPRVIILVDAKLDIVLRKLEKLCDDLHNIKNEIKTIQSNNEEIDIKVQEILNKQNESWFWSSK
jgi:hypothetical protein